MNKYASIKRLSIVVILTTILFNLFDISIIQGYEYKYNSENYQNLNVRLQDDFYTAINKDWIKNTKLDYGNVSYGTFEELYRKVNGDICNIICDINEHKQCYEKDSEEIKIANLYNNFIDIKQRDKLEKKPIECYMEKIDRIDNIEDLKKIFYDENFMYFQPLINIGVGPDYKDSCTNILYFENSSLTLGNSIYYKDNSYEDIRKEYVNYIEKLHQLCGENECDAKNNAERFYNIEKDISESIATLQEEAKDSDRINKIYNIFTMSEVQNIMPNINIKKILKSFDIENPNKIVVENPKNIEIVNSLIVEEKLDDMKNFFKTIILLNTDNLLSDDFRKASSNLKKKLYGVEVVDINESNAVKFVTCNLCESISKLYVNKYFDEESKKEVHSLCNEIVDNYRERLNNISWMSKKTKNKAIEKLDKINIKIGYPDKWNDYSELNIRSYSDGGNLVENIIDIYKFKIKRQIRKLGKPVDKSEWSMGACTVNAYYNPLNNEIVFPAAILQRPFYDKKASKEKNLGGIGAVIGHEVTHAFDNIGAQFDENGMLNNWWGENDYREFRERSKKVIDYYSNIEVENGRFVNGELTVGENISDLGGIACVIDIAKKIDNCNLKDLFENYAVIWREVSTEEIKDYLLNNDPHSPKKVRVNGVLSQFEEFYKVYDIKSGDKMYVEPSRRIKVW